MVKKAIVAAVAAVVVIVVVVAVVLALGGGVYGPSPQPGGVYGPGEYGVPQQPQQQQPSPPAEKPTVTIEVEAGEFYFEPSRIEVKAGEVVEIVITNVGRVFHTFTIDEFNIDIPLNPGETKRVVFRADKTGTFQIYCKPHRALGMVGELVVTG